MVNPTLRAAGQVRPLPVPGPGHRAQRQEPAPDRDRTGRGRPAADHIPAAEAVARVRLGRALPVAAEAHPGHRSDPLPRGADPVAAAEPAPRLRDTAQYPQ